MTTCKADTLAASIPMWTRRVLRALPKDRPIHLEKLIASVVDDSIGLDADTVVGVLFVCEMEGTVVQAPGKLFQLSAHYCQTHQ
jgi:hypothetical protein